MRTIGISLIATLLATEAVSAQVRADPGVEIGNRIAVRVNVTLADEETPYSPARDVALYRSVIGLCEALNLVVIAEGIETAEQAETVHNAGCRLALRESAGLRPANAAGRGPGLGRAVFRSAVVCRGGAVAGVAVT